MIIIITIIKKYANDDIKAIKLVNYDLFIRFNINKNAHYFWKNKIPCLTVNGKNRITLAWLQNKSWTVSTTAEAPYSWWWTLPKKIRNYLKFFCNLQMNF